MKIPIKKIADFLNGTIEGDDTLVIQGLAKIEDAEEGTITFLANPLYTPYVYKTNASAIVVRKDFVPEKKVKATLIRVDDPYKAFTELLEFYNGTNQFKTGIEPNAFIHPSAKIGKNVYIGAFAYIDEQVEIKDNAKIFPHVYLGANVKVGKNTVLYSGVKVYHDCIIGDNNIIHAGTIIGSDGFGFAPDGKDYKKIPQIGNVVIGNHVEIGANCTIDRATLGSTIIHDGVKMDNQIQIAHNVEVGQNTVIAAQTGISGSAKIGKYCQIGGQVGIAGHIQVSDHVKIGAKSGVTGRIKEGDVLLGAPALPIKDFRKSHVLFKNLGNLYDQIKELQKEIKSLKKERHE